MSKNNLHLASDGHINSFIMFNKVVDCTCLPQGKLSKHFHNKLFISLRPPKSILLQ